MRRDEAMAFISIGQQLERADITVRVLSVRADNAAATGGRDGYDEVHWMALLRSVAAYQPFRRAMPARPDASANVALPPSRRGLSSGSVLMPERAPGYGETAAWKRGGLGRVHRCIRVGRRCTRRPADAP